MLSSLGSTSVVPYVNITLENGQQVTVLLENPIISAWKATGGNTYDGNNSIVSSNTFY